MTRRVTDFRVEPTDYTLGLDALRAVREAVFVREQQVPPELEADALDPHCLHVIARDGNGNPIGTGRLIPPALAQGHDRPAAADPVTLHRPTPASAMIGRMAVLAEWRGRGVGTALLASLVELARAQGWRRLALNSQADAIPFYARHGFLPTGAMFMEAGIAHRTMRRVLDGPIAIEDRDGATCMVTAILANARRSVAIYSRELDPALFDAVPVLEAARSFATRTPAAQVRVLLQDPTTPQRAHAPLLTLAQRLPSVFAFRAVEDPVDLAYPSAFVVNDAGGWYFRGLGNRFDGEAALDGPARARQLREGFDRVWERARPISEYRALGI